MKKTLVFSVLALAAALFAGQARAQHSVKAQVVNLEPVEQLVIDGKFIIEMVPSFGDRVSVGGEDNVLDKIVSVKQGGKKVTIKNRNKAAMDYPATPIKFEYRNLSSIEVGGKTTLRFTTAYKGKQLTLVVKDEANVFGDMQVEKTANIELKDKAEITGTLQTVKGKLVIGPEAENHLNVNASGKFSKEQK